MDDISNLFQIYAPAIFSNFHPNPYQYSLCDQGLHEIGVLVESFYDNIDLEVLDEFLQTHDDIHFHVNTESPELDTHILNFLKFLIPHTSNK